MADLVFRVRRSGAKAEGTLTWAAKGLSSPAVSGPHGNGALPDGSYSSPRHLLLDKVGEPPYCDTVGGLGHCWLQAFEAAHGRTDLGVHPDGNVLGTEGCIGLPATSDSKRWYDAFYESNGLTIEVITE